MQSGYIIQRRQEPYIFTRLLLAWRMRKQEFLEWWEWAHRYGFSWHTMTIQGGDVEMRYIDDVQFEYQDFAGVDVSVIAEVRGTDSVELWMGTSPNFYDPPINAANGAVDGGVTPDIDMNVAFEPYDITLDVVPKEFILRTSVRPAAQSSIYAYAPDQAVAMTLLTANGVTTLAVAEDGVLRWHADASRTDGMLQLDAGEDYMLRFSADVGSVVTFWGATAWQ
jgi:hypothetical protein